MALESKVVSSNTINCPQGETGVITVLAYEDGGIEYRCTHYKKQRFDCKKDLKCEIYNNRGFDFKTEV